MRGLILIVCIVSASAFSVRDVGVAEAKPIRPAPTECRGSVRSFSPLLQTPSALPSTNATPSYSASITVDETTQSAVLGTLRAYFACVNAGDSYRALNLSTDDYARATIHYAREEQVSPQEIVQRYENSVLDPRVPAAWIVITDVRDFGWLEPDRVGVAVSISDPLRNPPSGSLSVTLKHTPQGWRIDAVFGPSST